MKVLNLIIYSLHERRIFHILFVWFSGITFLVIKPLTTRKIFSNPILWFRILDWIMIVAWRHWCVTYIFDVPIMHTFPTSENYMAYMYKEYKLVIHIQWNSLNSNHLNPQIKLELEKIWVTENWLFIICRYIFIKHNM